MTSLQGISPLPIKQYYLNHQTLIPEKERTNGDLDGCFQPILPNKGDRTGELKNSYLKRKAINETYVSSLHRTPDSQTSSKSSANARAFTKMFARRINLKRRRMRSQIH